ncbi:MAG: siderophore ABC transporter substrate-binding protein [Rhodobacterales bacterium]|nr:siderophore ABC transporter substrate-binding protein [Rhodobacterales bacterium]MDX5501281.1 siderophore ABC transporter substrate-binding protein [Rhodobacterales bacterium]
MLLRTLAALSVALAAALPGQAETYDHAQGSINLSGVPQRVLVFDVAALDTLTALGVAPAGVPSGRLPAYMADRVADDVPRVGTQFEPDIEASFAARPDLIIVGGRSSAKYADVAKLAPAIDLTVPRDGYLAGARRNVEMLGRMFDRQAEAAALLARYDAEVAALREVAPKAGRVLVMLTSGGRMSAHGPGSRFGVIHDDYGLTPAATGMDTGTHGQAISPEFIATTNPDWLLVVDRDAAIGREGEGAAALLDNELVHKTTAWQKGQILYLDAAAWYVAPAGITALTLGARQIRDAIAAAN